MQVKKRKEKLRGTLKHVYKEAGKAMHDYTMLEDNDKILVGVSGGKDSLTLLEILLMRKIRIPIDFSVVVCCVDMGLDTEQKEWLNDYFQNKGIEFCIKDFPVDKKDLDCFWCSWNRRKVLFETARDFNCNKVALAHHLDDIVETILLNMFAKGEISAMKPKLDFFDGEITMIRPFSYLEERHIQRLAEQLGFCDNDWQCPRDKDTKRASLKSIIAQLKKEFPYIKTNVFRALKKERIKEDYLV